MAIKIVTAHKGEPHLEAADVGGMQQGIFGTDDYVLDVGKKLEAVLVTNNSIRINDGEVVMQGRHFRVELDTYETVTIDNGAQNMKRKDLIVARYTKNSSTGVEDVEIVVLKGIAVSAGIPIARTPVKGDIRAYDLKHEMILYTVELNGLNIVSVKPAFYVLMSMDAIRTRFSDLDTELGARVQGKAKEIHHNPTEVYSYFFHAGSILEPVSGISIPTYSKGFLHVTEEKMECWLVLIHQGTYMWDFEMQGNG